MQPRNNAITCNLAGAVSLLDTSGNDAIAYDLTGAAQRIRFRSICPMGCMSKC